MKFPATMAIIAAVMPTIAVSTSPAFAESNAVYDHVIECSSAVAVVAALVEGNTEIADVAKMMSAATPKWLDKGRAMKVKSDEAVMEDHKAAVTKRLQLVLEDTSANNDRVNELVGTAINCVNELN